jgi:hypothetical protein
MAWGACLTFRKISTCPWTRPRLTRTNRGALWQNGGSKRRAFSESNGKPWFKETFYEIELVTSSFVWNFNEVLIQSLLIGLSIPLYLLLPPVFNRLDSFLWCSLRLDALDSRLEDLSFSTLIDQLLHHTFVPRIRYLGFTTRGKKGPLTMTEDLSACKSKRTLTRIYTVNKPLFLAPLPGNKWSRFDLLLLFV